MNSFKLTVSLLGAGLVLGLAGCGEKDNEDTGPEVVAEDCSNLIDDDGDGATDCSDSDCASLEECQVVEEICDNEIDDNENGAIDCDDPDCDGDGSCPSFFPYVFGFSVSAGFDGEGLVAYGGTDNTGTDFRGDPTARVDFYEAEYFDTQGDERYSCGWIGDLNDVEITALETVALSTGEAGPTPWLAWTFGLTLNQYEGQDNTNCEGFDNAVWGGASSGNITSPTSYLESLTWGFGVAALDSEVASSLSTNYPTDWTGDGDSPGLSQTLAGEYYAGDTDAGELAIPGWGYCFVYEAEWRELEGVQTLAYVTDDDDFLVPRLVGEDWNPDDGLPADSIIRCSSWYLPEPTWMGLAQ